MHKWILGLIAAVLVGLVIIAGKNIYTFDNNESHESTPSYSVEQTAPAVSTEQPEVSQPVVKAPFNATFNININGIDRIFTAAMYLDQSSEVYIPTQDPTTLVVERYGITWKEFFETLPFKLDTDCITTGLGETFCIDETHSLDFFLNGKLTPDALTKQIEPNDELNVYYQLVVY